MEQMVNGNSLISEELEKRIERNFIGESKEIKKVYELAMTAAKYKDTNVLITGESGTGKENIARIIHYASERKNNNFCVVNSSAITDSLLESEFFGHIKGAFTGAIENKKGYFEVANKGSLFLDEIADMPFNLQSKLLRATEEKKITKVGGTHEISVDFRIVSATNHNIEKLISNNMFRLDLFYRLNTLQIHIPPLRERHEDIEPLLRFFVKDFAIKMNKQVPNISQQLMEELKKYDFPGNVREMRNMVERAIIFCNNSTLSIHDFLINHQETKTKVDLPPKFNLNEVEIQLIQLALNNNNYNQRKSSELLGISRDALIRRMKKYNIVVHKNC